MAQVRQHLNARLTPRQRRALVEVILEQGWGVGGGPPERFQVSAKNGAQVA